MIEQIRDAGSTLNERLWTWEVAFTTMSDHSCKDGDGEDDVDLSERLDGVFYL